MSILCATWNVLASGYVRADYYPRTPAALLEPARRHPALALRAQGLGADLLCLQEVEPTVFALLREALPDHRGWYAPRPGRPDGCALFARAPLLEADEVEALAYHDAPAGGRPSGHLAQLARLRWSGAVATVANTHLRWDPPGRPEDQRVGLRQAQLLLAALARRGQAAAIVCGDFNAVPGDAVLRAFAAAGFAAAHPPEAATCNPSGRAKAIDFLLLRSLRAQPEPPPPVDDATPLPSAREPSDHVPLLARLLSGA